LSCAAILLLSCIVFFLSFLSPPLISPLFPYTTLFRSIVTALISGLLATVLTIFWQKKETLYNRKMKIFETLMSYRYMIASEESVDRKSTRLNSSHVSISYAVFCLKKQKTDNTSKSNIG